MKFLTGISLATWLKIGGGIALALFVWSWHSRGNEINDLRTDLITEQALHDVTRASLKSSIAEIEKQNAAIEAQRAAQAQAQRDLSAAIAATVGSQDVIERLAASARSVPAGAVCEPSEAVRSIWK